MVKLVAKQPIDSNALPGLSMLFMPSTAYFYDRGSKEFKVAPDASLEGTLLEVGGHGFRHLFSRPTGAGTVSQLTVHDDATFLYKLSGLDVDLRAIFKADGTSREV